MPLAPSAGQHCSPIGEKRVTAKLVGGPDPAVSEDKPKHQKNPSVGTKKVVLGSTVLVEQVDARSFKEGEEITLMGWGNAFVAKIVRPDPAGDVSGLELKLHLEGDFKKTEKKVTWLAKDQPLVDVELVDFDYLITKDRLKRRTRRISGSLSTRTPSLGGSPWRTATLRTSGRTTSCSLSGRDTTGATSPLQMGSRPSSSASRPARVGNR